MLLVKFTVQALADLGLCKDKPFKLPKIISESQDFKFILTSCQFSLSFQYLTM